MEKIILICRFSWMISSMFLTLVRFVVISYRRSSTSCFFIVVVIFNLHKKHNIDILKKTSFKTFCCQNMVAFRVLVCKLFVVLIASGRRRRRATNTDGCCPQSTWSRDETGQCSSATGSRYYFTHRIGSPNLFVFFLRVEAMNSSIDFSAWKYINSINFSVLMQQFHWNRVSNKIFKIGTFL